MGLLEPNIGFGSISQFGKLQPKPKKTPQISCFFPLWESPKIPCVLVGKNYHLWRNIPFKIQSRYFPYRKINFRVGNQLTGSVIVGLFQTSSLSAISRV